MLPWSAAAPSSLHTDVDASFTRRCRRGSRAALEWSAARFSLKARIDVRCRHFSLFGAPGSSSLERGAFGGASTSIHSALPDGNRGSSPAARYNPTLCRTPPFATNPLIDLKSQLGEWLSAGLARVAPGHAPQPIGLERPKQAQYGDYSSNVALQLAKLRGLVSARGLALEVSAEAMSWLAEAGYDPLYGARPLKRVIQRELQNLIAMRLLEGKYNEGDTIRIGVDETGLTFSEG